MGIKERGERKQKAVVPFFFSSSTLFVNHNHLIKFSLIESKKHRREEFAV